MQLRFSDLVKDDIEHSGRSRKNGENIREVKRVQKLDLVTVITWVEQQNNVYEREGGEEESTEGIEIKISEVSRQ